MGIKTCIHLTRRGLICLGLVLGLTFSPVVAPKMAMAIPIEDKKNDEDSHCHCC